MLAISNSEINLWKRCRRQWFVTYYLGFLPASEPSSSKKNMGSRIHVALEGYFGYQLDPLNVLAMLYTVELGKHPEEEAELRTEWETSKIMVEGYLEWLAAEGKDAELEVVATEADIQVPCPGLPGVLLRARLDQAMRRTSDGALIFKDYKTAPGFEKHQVLELDPQMRYYCLIQQLASGHLAGVAETPVVAGGCIDTLRRVKRSAASKPPYYQRDYFSYNPDQIQSTLLRSKSAATQILMARNDLDVAYARGGRLEVINEMQRYGLAPTPIVDRCSWDCPFSSGLCTMMDDGSDWTGLLVSSGRYVQGDPYAYYRNDALRTLHAELEKLK